MSSEAVHNSAKLIEYIEAAGESANMDAKGPVTWDGKEESAALTKDILALANCRDGGVLVIGKSEPNSGKFLLEGLTEDQAASFDTTKVATWVNNHCSPRVNLICYRQEYDGKQFVIVAVQEFHDIPVVCKKNFELPVNGKQKTILRKGTIYVRTPNAASEPLSEVEELRELIGLATTKRADQMLEMFQAMMKGQPLVQQKSTDEHYQPEVERIQDALSAELGSEASQGMWTFSCFPGNYQENRWEDFSTLKAVLEKCVVRVRKEFPQTSHGVQLREWGILNRYYEDAFGFAHSGLFVSQRLFKENRRTFKNHWQPNPDIPPGKWLDFKHNVSIIIEFYAFLSRYAHNFDTGEEIIFGLVAQPLAGRQLTADSSFPFFDPSQPSKSNLFHLKKRCTVENLRANWQIECGKAVSIFLDYFARNEYTQEGVVEMVNKFMDRQF